ncbi:MAG: serine/threonine kinase family protein [Myxococcales bacterium]|nr:serine/threonine kinase family protein [Myxococcales bacterium]
MNHGDDLSGGEAEATITATGVTTSSPALERGASFGRYLVLERLGAGGMGVVYSAYDPELDRKVAIKILRPDAVRDQSRLRREAQAMARLQHPNAISVYDVGMFQDRVFVAMELVDGTTLAQWLKAETRSWREVVDVFLQAGRGLAAAHAVGLVHRDFKPANALIGRDGRVRVVDFGLARSVDSSSDPLERAPSTLQSPILQETVTRTGALLGTPTYMSPEQFLGMPTEAKSDQFSFSVAVYRALYGERPFAGDDLSSICDEVTSGRLKAPPKDSRVPAWVREVVLRGLATKPEQRWPSMAVLLAALSHDPVRVRRRWMLRGGAVAVLAVLGLGYSALQHRESLVCRGAERNLVGVWDQTRKNAMQASFAATGKPYAEAAFRSVARTLDAFANAWTSMHTEACQATRVRREQSEESLDLRMECLGQRLREAKAQVDLLTNADDQVVQNAVQITSSLNVSDCSDLAGLRAPVRPPADPATRALVDELRKKLAQAKSLKLAGKYKEALTIAGPAVAEAHALAYRPLEAEALYWQGTLQKLLGDFKAAEKAMDEATFVARAGRHTSIEAHAWAGLIGIAVLQGRFEPAHVYQRRGLAAVEALGGSDESAVADLLGNLAHLSHEEGKAEEALDYRRRQLAILERSGPENPALPVLLGYVGQLLGELGQHEEAERQIRRALTISEKELGPDHPEVGSTLLSLAATLFGQDRFDESLSYYRRTLAVWEKTLGPEYPRLVDPLVGIAAILTIQGKYEEALAAARRVMAISEKQSGPLSNRAGYALLAIGDILRVQGKYDDALVHFRRALAVFERVYGVDHPMVAFPLIGIGRCDVERHKSARALPFLERALALGDKQPSNASYLAEGQFAMARALWDTGRDPQRGRSLAAQARSGYAGGGARTKKDLSEVDAWLVEHR